MIVTNGLCQNGTKAVIFLRSIGTEVITLSDVIVMDLSEGGGMINESEWKTPNGSQVLAQLPPGESVMYVANCSGDCVFRFFTGSMGVPAIFAVLAILAEGNRRMICSTISPVRVSGVRQSTSG